MDIQTFCMQFYASQFIPIAYFQGNKPVCVGGYQSYTKPYWHMVNHLFATTKDAAIYYAPDSGFYGIIKCKETTDFFTIGPTYSESLTDDMLEAYLEMHEIDVVYKEEVGQMLSAIPLFSFSRFTSLLAFVNFLLNGEVLPIEETFNFDTLRYKEMIATKNVRSAIVLRDEQQLYGTYDMEQRIYAYIREGNVAALERFIDSSRKGRHLTKGRQASDPIRHRRNIFNGFVNCVGKFAAIPGGLDVEMTYQLIELYIQECESLHSFDDIRKLTRDMLVDFATRVAQAKLPDDCSSEIYYCMQYIKQHINEPIDINSVADFTKKSRAYITAKFHRETGHSITEYIRICRIHEAANLLRYTNNSISQISEYLCFSSQPYFQNVFKKEMGTTPHQYRQQSAFPRDVR